MKLTLQLTLDGLIDALRLKAHGLAEDIEYRRRRDVLRNAAALSTPAEKERRTGREAGHEFGD